MKQRRRQSIALNNEILYRAEAKVKELAMKKKAEEDRLKLNLNEKNNHHSQQYYMNE